MSEAISTLDVVSDAICPWCFVGKRRLERAFLLLAGEGRRFTLRWQPFELNPGMPPEGMDRRSYRSAKFGSWERAQRLDERVAMVGREDGITFRYDLMEGAPRTFDAHRLIWLAGREGVQDAVVEALFAAYFTRGRDIGDLEVLAAVAGEAGLEYQHVLDFLRGAGGAAEVRAAARMALEAGIAGVPTVLRDGEPLFSGA